MEEVLFLAEFKQRWEAERSNPCKRILVTGRLRLLFFPGVLVMDKKQLQPGDLSALPHTVPLRDLYFFDLSRGLLETIGNPGEN